MLSISSARAYDLEPYLAQSDQPTPAVIVCPGGSYSWLDDKNEGELVARWLQSEGISAFLLRYPVQGVASYLTHYRLLFRGRQYPDAQQALQDAISHIRDNAAQYRIDPNKVGAMGFSAGGHLVASVAEYCQDPRVRPDFVAPIYPVVTMRQNSWVHKRSRRALLGEYRKHSTVWRDSLSLELHAHPAMPPVFLVNCIDDPVVHYHNSELLDSALTANDVPHLYLQYHTGGHGFGASDKKGTAECRQWREAFLGWLRSLFD